MQLLYAWNFNYNYTLKRVVEKSKLCIFVLVNETWNIPKTYEKVKLSVFTRCSFI